MQRSTLRAAGLAAITLRLAAACAGPTDTSTATTSLTTGFQSVPLAFSNVSSSFAMAADGGTTEWGPPGRDGRGPGGGHPGPGGPGGPGRIPFMMGGGLGDAFLGLGGFGLRFGHRPPQEGDRFHNCDFNSATGRVECEVETEHGLTITRSAAFKDANGNTQSAFDSATTNLINTRMTVTGTISRHDGATSQVEHQSDRTVSGLKPGSIQRTVSGTSGGEEVTSGTDSTGAFTVVRTVGDTIQAVVIPVTDGKPAAPLSGTVTRAMQVAVTRAGSTTTSTRRELITYDGSDTAKITITQDGVTKSCTLPLPRGHLTCA